MLFAARQRGWTVIEMAVVLIIIALIAAAMIKGQAMIQHSRAKAVIADFSGVSVATSLYFDRYRYLPGDDPNAGARWGNGVVSGNGDRALQGTYNNTLSDTPTSADETNLFWWHLRLAGLLAGGFGPVDGPSLPFSTSRGHLGVQEAGGKLGGLTGTIICSEVPDQVAIAIDNQLDDQNPAGGAVRAMAAGFNQPLTATPIVKYDEDNKTYTICALLNSVGSK